MEQIISIDGLCKSFGDVKAVQNLSFQVKKGELFAFLGVNGAGKSTTISILCGQLAKDAGTVFVCGEDVEKGMEKICRKLGVVFQSSVLDKALTVRDNLQSRAALYGITGKEFKKRLAELASLLDFENLLNRTVGKLSGGQRRRIDIARAILHKPELLILDEPTNDLDIETMTILEDYLDDFDGIVITVSHDRYFLDRIVTRIFAFEENGAIRQYEGGYTDYVKKRPASTENSFDGKTKSHTGNKEAHRAYKNREKKLKFSYQEQREYETIEEDISVLETTIETLDKEMAENGTDYVKLRELSEKKEEAEEQLMEKMERWEYLEELAEKIANQ